MLARHLVGRRLLGPLVGHFDALSRVGRFGRCLASEAEPGSSAGRATSAGRAYLARNAEREGVRTSATGLQYRVLRSGAADAAQPTAASSCECHYRGRFPDGVEFDSSYERLGAPALLSKAGEQLPGWSEALLLMREGDAWELTLPPELAHGAKANGPIPPNSVVIYELELLKVRPNIMSL